MLFSKRKSSAVAAFAAVSIERFATLAYDTPAADSCVPGLCRRLHPTTALQSACGFRRDEAAKIATYPMRYFEHEAVRQVVREARADV